MRDRTTLPILSEDLWARVALSQASSGERCSVNRNNRWRQFGVYGQGKRLRCMGYGRVSLNLSAACGGLCLNLYQRAHEIILFWDAKLFHSGSNSGTPWHLKKGLVHALVGISRARRLNPYPGRPDVQDFWGATGNVV